MSLKMCFVYSLYNQKHNKIYIGQCKDLEARLKMHSDKIFKSCYTARFDGFWELVYKEKVENRQEALKREKQLKSYRGRQFIKNLTDS